MTDTVAGPFVRAGVSVPAAADGTAWTIVDWTLPAQVPIVEVLGFFVPRLRKRLAESGRERAWLDDPRAHWKLRTEEGVFLEESQSLAEQGVPHGALLFLVRDSRDEYHVPIFDDVAEMIAYYLGKNYGEWDNHASRLLVAWLAPPLAALAGVCALANAASLDVAARAGLAAGFAVFGALLLAYAAIGPRRERAIAQYSSAATACGYVFVCVAALACLPRALAAPQLVIAAAVLAPVSFLMFALAPAAGRLHYGALAIAVVTAIGCAHSLWGPQPLAVLCAQTALASAAFAIVSSRIAQWLARIRVPRVLATGEDFTADFDSDVANAPNRSGSERAIEDVTNQESRVKAMYEAEAGMAIGALAASVGALAALGRFHREDGPAVLWFVIALALAYLYCGKSHVDKLLQGSYLVGSVAALAAFSAGSMWNPASIAREDGLVALSCLLGGVFVAALAAAGRSRAGTPVMMRALERVERLVYLSLPVSAAVIMHLFQAARSI